MKILVTGGAGFIGSNFVLYVHRELPDATLVTFATFTVWRIKAARDRLGDG